MRVAKEPRKPKKNPSRLKKIEKKIFSVWMEFSHRHHSSIFLPLALFFLLYVDGFVMVIPSLLCLIAAVTISPERWVSLGLIAATASATNNATTYLIGRFLPPKMIDHLISSWGLENLWLKAQTALSHYGPFATFIATIFSLPSQFVTAIIGLADAERMRGNPGVSSSFLLAIFFAFIGSSIKCLIVAGLTRYGWVSLEKKLERDL